MYTVADGGYASKENLEIARQRNIKDVAFHKKRGLGILDMAKSPWVYKKLRNFRAGIEAGISYLKGCFGLSRLKCNYDNIKRLYQCGSCFFNNSLNSMLPLPGVVW